MTLVEFLLARTTEDEAVATAARDIADHSPAPGRWHEYNEDGDMNPDLGFTVEMSLTRADHIGRFDPLRMLAECAAKRHLLSRHEATTATHNGAVVEVCWYDGHPYPCPDVAGIAALYADHPDFDADWSAG